MRILHQLILEVQFLNIQPSRHKLFRSFLLYITTVHTNSSAISGSVPELSSLDYSMYMKCLYKYYYGCTAGTVHTVVHTCTLILSV
jgi:hypothetical protein